MSDELKLALDEIKNEQVNLLKSVEVLSIKNDKDMTDASEILAEVKSRIKVVENKRVEYVKPLNDQVKKINADFKAVTNPLIELESSLKVKISKYVMEKERIAREELRKAEEARRKEAEKIAKSQDITKRQALAQVEKPELEEVKTSVETATAKVVTKLVTKFEVIDPSKVPDEYKIVDERLVRKAINSGVKKIAGVKIWEERQVSAF